MKTPFWKYLLFVVLCFATLLGWSTLALEIFGDSYKPGFLTLLPVWIIWGLLWAFIVKKKNSGSKKEENGSDEKKELAEIKNESAEEEGRGEISTPADMPKIENKGNGILEGSRIADSQSCKPSMNPFCKVENYRLAKVILGIVFLFLMYLFALNGRYKPFNKILILDQWEMQLKRPSKGGFENYE